MFAGPGAGGDGASCAVDDVRACRRRACAEDGGRRQAAPNAPARLLH